MQSLVSGAHHSQLPGGRALSRCCWQWSSEASEIFIDRDGTHFRQILNWFRMGEEQRTHCCSCDQPCECAGHVVLPDETASLELLAEADFYGVEVTGAHHSPPHWSVQQQQQQQHCTASQSQRCTSQQTGCSLISSTYPFRASSVCCEFSSWCRA